MSTPESNMDSYGYKPNQNENLISTNNLNSPNIENPYIISGLDDNFVIYKSNYSYCFMLTCMICVPVLLPFLIIPFLLMERKLEITKNENNEIVVIVTTFGGCKKRYTFPIESTAFEVISGSVTVGEQEQQTVKIIFYNMSLKEIDLDNSNIRNAPFNCIVIFENYLGRGSEVQSQLSKYSNNYFDNKINDELKLYVPNFQNNNGNSLFPQFMIHDDRKGYNQIVKISDYYYVYHAFNYYHSADHWEAFRRIDWIYSKNFDRIFIGVIQGDNYKKSGTYNINEIDKFVLKSNNNNNRYCLRICLKDGRSEDLCEFMEQNQKVLDSFIYLINGQINKITKNE